MSRCRDNINLPRMRAEARMYEVQLGASQRRVSVLTDISSLHSFALKCLQEYFGTLYRISLGISVFHFKFIYCIQADKKLRPYESELRRMLLCHRLVTVRKYAVMIQSYTTPMDKSVPFQDS